MGERKIYEIKRSKMGNWRTYTKGEERGIEKLSGA